MIVPTPPHHKSAMSLTNFYDDDNHKVCARLDIAIEIMSGAALDVICRKSESRGTR